MTGRALPPSSPFGGDDGSAPAALAAALTQADPAGRLAAVVEALRTERVLIPVVARLDEMDEPGAHGVAGEKSAHTAMVTVAAPDGRAVIPVFSGVAAMHAWRADARPVPVEGRRAALAAGTEAAGLLVLDPGAASVLVPRPAVRAIALGEPWLPALRNPVVHEALRVALTPVPGVQAVALEPGRDTEVTVVVHLEPRPQPWDERAVTATLQACQQQLAAAEEVVDLVDSVAVRAVLGR